MFWLLKIAKQFSKLAQLEFGEKTKWIPQEFKEYSPFKTYPSKTLIKDFCKYHLDDFRIPIVSDNTELANKLIVGLLYHILDAENSIVIKKDHLYLEDKENAKQINELDQLERQIKNLRNLLRGMESNFDPENIVLPREILLGARTLPIGYSLFKVYNYLQQLINNYYKLPNLDSISEFKNYSKRPKNFYIVFSTKLEDLVGISTRGITTCQNILDSQNEKYWKNLAGTVLSRNIGVIYVTSGSDVSGRGERMLYRSLVRIMYSPEDDNNIIVIDKMYPSIDGYYMDKFEESLKEYSDLPVISLDYNSEIQYKLETIPEEIPEEYESYSDFTFKRNPKQIDKMFKSENFVDRELVIEYVSNDDLRLLDLLNDKMDFIRKKAAEKIDLNLLRDYVNKNLNKKDILAIFQERENEYFEEQGKIG